MPSRSEVSEASNGATSAALATATNQTMQWRAYYLLVLLRLVLSVCSRSTIHPDEFFQSQEVMARHVIANPHVRNQLFIPWEYQLPHPNRSILFPALIAGLPYKFLELLGVEMAGHVLLLVPRVLLCVLSLGIDAVLYAVACKRKHANPLSVLLCFGSSWTTLIFLSRPFSNTFETWILAMCTGALHLVSPTRYICGRFHLQTVVLGALLAIGFFTRFTFLFFFFPIGLQLVLHQDALLRASSAKKTDTSSSISPMQQLWNALAVALQGFMAFVVCGACFVAMDTWYFHGNISWKELVIAPLNNLQYNLQYDNLELHGVHPRITHVAVYMPMLFGPLFLQFLIKLKSMQWSDRMHVLFPIACLSMAPHQEARFLLPVLVPLHLSIVSHKSLLFPYVWIIFNVVLAVVFGLLHQGGLVPMLLALSSSTSSASCHFMQPMVFNHAVVFYKTYMPPRFLLAGLNATDGFQVMDLAGLEPAQAQDRFHQLLQNDTKQLSLVLPASIPLPIDAETLQYEHIGSCFPHLSTENVALDRPLTLDLYKITHKGGK